MGYNKLTIAFSLMKVKLSLCTWRWSVSIPQLLQ